MGTRIMVGAEGYDNAGKAVLYDSTGGAPFGRIFDCYDDAEAFFRWYTHRWGDPRRELSETLASRISHWHANVRGNPVGDVRAGVLYVCGGTYFDVLRAHAGYLRIATHGPGGANDVREDVHDEGAWIKAHRADGTQQATEEECDAYYAMLEGKVA